MEISFGSRYRAQNCNHHLLYTLIYCCGGLSSLVLYYGMCLIHGRILGDAFLPVIPFDTEDHFFILGMVIGIFCIVLTIELIQNFRQKKRSKKLEQCLTELQEEYENQIRHSKVLKEELKKCINDERVRSTGLIDDQEDNTDRDHALRLKYQRLVEVIDTQISFNIALRKLLEEDFQCVH